MPCCRNMVLPFDAIFCNEVGARMLAIEVVDDVVTPFVMREQCSPAPPPLLLLLSPSGVVDGFVAALSRTPLHNFTPLPPPFNSILLLLLLFSWVTWLSILLLFSSFMGSCLTILPPFSAPVAWAKWLLLLLWCRLFCCCSLEVEGFRVWMITFLEVVDVVFVIKSLFPLASCWITFVDLRLTVDAVGVLKLKCCKKEKKNRRGKLNSFNVCQPFILCCQSRGHPWQIKILPVH